MPRSDVTDTMFPLEWDEVSQSWSIPLLNHDWAELVGILKKSNKSVEKVSPDHYQLRRDSNGQHCIVWTGGNTGPPSRLYGLVKVKPKPAQMFLGLPIPVLVALIGLSGTLLGAIVLHFFTALKAKPTESKKPAAVLQEECPAVDELQQQLKEQISANSELESRINNLEPYKHRQELEHEFLGKFPNDREIYLIGQSHGLRLSAINNWKSNEEQSRIILEDVENNYIKNILGPDYNHPAYVRGKSQGMEDAIRALSLGDPDKMRLNSSADKSEAYSGSEQQP
jgi:hypothetical protein